MDLNTQTARRAIHALDAAKERLAAAQEDVREASSALAGLVKNETGTHTVHFLDSVRHFTVSENNTYDTALMLAALKPGQVQRVTERRVVPGLVKTLYPEVYKGAKDARGVKVTLR